MRRPDVAIIDGGGANIASLQYALGRLDAPSVLTADAATIRSASHVILPGVGAARPAMQRLADHDLMEVVRKLERPVLGICLGMQLMGAGSAEDDAECLSIFPDRAMKLQASPATPVPNMGWCRTFHRRDTQLLDGIRNGSWFYFVHSYALPVNDSTVATAVHRDDFSAVMVRNNFHAAQFHPERSSAAGMRLLRNFLETER